MTLYLYDSASRTTRAFVPRQPGRVGMYLCGATVQSSPHIGHLRSAVAFDIARRWLERSGYEVTFIRNVTDIDDKILTKSAEAGAHWWAWAYRHEQEFTAAYDALGLLRPTYEPRATGHVPEMIELMGRLIERGHAYVGDPGNVYFDVRSWGEYGSLTHQLLESLAGEDEADVPGDKRDSRDFALWKAAKPGEPATAAWPTPYGRGRPGWHLECSAMAHRYLGEAFDIHAGGFDLRFPHHENEQAQSRAAGWDFAGTWMHNAWVTVGGEKMGKSLGNALAVSEVLKDGPPVVLRYALSAVHYRSTLEFTPGASMAGAAAAWERIAGFTARAAELDPAVAAAEPAQVDLPAEFVAAMDEDLNVSAALAIVHEHVRLGNAALAGPGGPEAGRRALGVRAMLDVLGLDPLAPRWRSGGGGDEALGVLVSAVLADRARARDERDWARADELRDLLTRAGVVVEDGPEGARWTVKRNHGR
ncbi:cysteine--tRNA ligase [Pseudactinotalea sp. HY158]|uniref:cysteine--tRNA ligase n=1 Tax=Pseudactinotalea sp. HY158 TaxID=2654547 RepID=UPI00129C3EF3|nr:cysteine--tRNA ligase [Pseudactinotalea sp. HY158]QGH68424.1 cysteine--tRNA ligase [Pseudactinotalea sp. HY158]